MSCWDLDGDGVDDPGEDVNGDGIHDAADCQGPEGSQGPKGDPGEAAASLDDLDGTPCNVGTDYPGTLSIQYDGTLPVLQVNMECVTTPARVHVTARGGGTWIGGCEATGTVEVFEGSVSGNNLVAQVSPDSGFSTCTSESDRNNYVPEGELIWVRVTPNTSTDQGGNTARATTSPAGLCPSIDGTVAGTQLCYFNISGAADITVDFLNTEVP